MAFKLALGLRSVIRALGSRVRFGVVCGMYILHLTKTNIFLKAQRKE